MWHSFCLGLTKHGSDFDISSGEIVVDFDVVQLTTTKMTLLREQEVFLCTHMYMQHAESSDDSKN